MEMKPKAEPEGKVEVFEDIEVFGAVNDYFAGAFFVLTPSNDTLTDMVAKLSDKHNYTFGEQVWWDHRVSGTPHV